jgi:uncharacterized iron-regulated protein
MPTIHNKPRAGKTGFPFIVYLLIVLCVGAGKPAQAAGGDISPMSPAPGLIYDVAKGNYVRLETLQSAAAGAKYILLGETHDNLIHHQRQAELVDVLSGDGLKRAVVWEMINRDQQKDLDDAWHDKKRAIDDIGVALDWDNSGWPSWQDYSPIAEAARQHQLPMIAGNLPDDIIGPLIEKGNAALPASLAKKLALPPLPDETKTLFDREIVDAHCGVLSPDQAPPFSTIQFARDASLARAMFDASKQKGIKGAFLITGAMHARANVAVPWQLKRFDPKGTSIVIIMREAPNPGDPSVSPANYLKAYGPGHSVDFIWFTSDLARSNPCDGITMPHARKLDAQDDTADDNEAAAPSTSENTSPPLPDAPAANDDVTQGDDQSDDLTTPPANQDNSAKTAPPKTDPAPHSGPMIDPEPSNNPMRRIMPIPPARPQE